MFFSTAVYGFDRNHRVIEFQGLRPGKDSFWVLKNVRDWMARENIAVDRIYAIQNSGELCRDFQEMMRSKDFARWYEFEDTVRTNGILIFER